MKVMVFDALVEEEAWSCRGGRDRSDAGDGRLFGRGAT